MPPAAAIILGATVAAGATVYGASKASKATKEAAQIQATGTQEAIDTEWEMFQQSREDFAPWREAGVSALGQLEEAIAAGPGEFVFDPETEPGFKFGFEEFVRKPYLQAQSAKGKRLSGETLKGLTGFAEDYAETRYQSKYQNFLNNYYRSLNPLQSMAGVGQTAVGQQAVLGGQTASAVAGLQAQGAQTQAQSALQLGNIATGASAGVAGVGQNALQQYMTYQLMQQLGVG